MTSAAGFGKSPAAKCIANCLTVSYDTNYLMASSPEALRPESPRKSPRPESPRASPEPLLSILL